MYGGDGTDLCYVKDCGRAIALLQTADRLAERTYNVSSGRLTTNAEVVAAIGQAVPGWRFELPERGPEDGPDPSLYLDISRISQRHRLRAGLGHRARGGGLYRLAAGRA